MNYKIFALIALFFSSFSVDAQDDRNPKMDTDDSAKESSAPKNSIGITRVRDSIYMLKGRGGNIGLSFGKDGAFMIDDQFANASQDILLRVRSITNKPITFVVNTHHHGDHTGGNSNMAATGATIVSHENARRRMVENFTKPAREVYQKKLDSVMLLSGDKITSDETRKDAYINAEKIIGSIEDYVGVPEGSLPILSFTENLIFNYNGEKIQVIHLPRAHTDGDVMIHFTESNVLHTGDVFFNGAYPFIDTKSSGSPEGYLAGLNRIMRTANKDTKIIPGHGELATLDDVKYTHDMIKYLYDAVKYHVVAGKSEAEILAMSDLTKEYDNKGYGDGFITTERFMKLLYDDVARKYPALKK